MLLWMLVAIQVAALLLAIVAIAMGWNYAFVVVGVVIFLVHGHLVRRELRRRGYWRDEHAASTAATDDASAKPDEEAGAEGPAPSSSDRRP